MQQERAQAAYRNHHPPSTLVMRRQGSPKATEAALLPLLLLQGLEGCHVPQERRRRLWRDGLRMRACVCMQAGRQRGVCVRACALCVCVCSLCVGGG